MFSCRRGFTLEEALQMVFSDDIDEIYIEPPDAAILTDEDSGEEDGGGVIDNLSGAQLRAPAEVILHNNERIGGDDQLLNAEDKIVVQNNSSQPLLVQLEKPNWCQGDLQPPNSNFQAGTYVQYKHLTPTQFFEKFIDDDVIQLLLEETSKYALFRNCADPKVSKEEMRCFIGILVLSGYNELPSKRHYWDIDSDMRNELVYKSMRRDRFLQISKFLHFADNNKPDLTDKIWKLRPIMDKVKQTFLHYFGPEENLCYDESMVKYFGRHSCKQFIRGKPVRFGYKIWCLNTPSGYLTNFEMYQGNNPRRSLVYEKLFGKASAQLVTMLDELKALKGTQPYKLYFDNLFTGMTLLKYLRDNNYEGTGTIRENRVPKGCPLTNKKAIEKRPRGTYESTLDKANGIILVRWVDNGVVTTASTCFGTQPLNQVKRYSQSEKKIIHVPRPHLISKYNSSMGGTDLMDENISRYRISMRGKKWWWCLFSWLLDACIQNAWQMHKKSGGVLPQLEFRREISKTYLKSYGVPPKAAGRTPTASTSVTLNRISDDLRYDQRNHLVVRVPDNKRRRCAGEGCSSSGRTMCSKCDVGLCIDCFYIFHNK